MPRILLFVLTVFFSLSSYAQTITIGSASGEAAVQKSTPNVPSIPTGERFAYTIQFQNLNSLNTLSITDIIPNGLCYETSDIRANSSFVDFSGNVISNPNGISGLIDTSALPTVVFNIPSNVQRGSFTITVSFCAGETADGFSVENNICASYTANSTSEEFCSTSGLVSTASAVNPWGDISKEPIFPSVANAAGNSFIRDENGRANFRIVVQKAAAFQGTTFGMLNLMDVSISEIASPPCAVVTLESGPGTYDAATNRIILDDDLLGADATGAVEFIVAVDYSACGKFPPNTIVQNMVQLNGTPVGESPETNIANDTAEVIAIETLPSPFLNSTATKDIQMSNRVAGCIGTFDIEYFNSDNRPVSLFNIVETLPAGITPTSYFISSTENNLSSENQYEVLIDGISDRVVDMDNENGRGFGIDEGGSTIQFTATENTIVFPQETLFIRIFFTIEDTVAPGTFLESCMRFDGSLVVTETDREPIGNDVCLEILVEEPQIDLCVSKFVRRADTENPFESSIVNMVPNDEVEFQICAQNNGGLDFVGSLIDVLDPKYEVISVNNETLPEGVTFTQTGQTLRWDNLPLEQLCEQFAFTPTCGTTSNAVCITVRARIRPFTEAGNIDNGASILDDQGNEIVTSGFAKVNVEESSVFLLTKEVSADNVSFQTENLSVDPVCSPNIFYRIRVENIGNSPATQIQIYDELPGLGDVFYPSTIARSSTFSLTDVIVSAPDFTTTFLDDRPSNSVSPAGFNCASVPAGNASFGPATNTIRFESTSGLAPGVTFTIDIQASFPDTDLSRDDIVVNSAYLVNCTLGNSIVIPSSITSPATITIDRLVYAGIDAETTVCNLDPSFDLFELLGDEPTEGGTWSPALSSGTGLFDPTIDAPGTYTYTVGLVGCNDDTSEVAVNFFPEVIIATPQDLVECDNTGPNDGVRTWDFSTQEVDILNGLDPALYTITYHLNEMDAQEGANILPDAYTNTDLIEVIYVRVEDNATGCYSPTSFTITTNLLPISQLEPANTICLQQDEVPEERQRVTILDTGLTSDNYSFMWSLDGIPLSTIEGLYIAETIGTYQVVITDLITDCVNISTTVVQEEPVITATAEMITEAFSTNPVIQVTAVGAENDNFEYQLDDGFWQRSNLFRNPRSGLHTITVRGDNSCGIATTTIFVLRYPQFFTPNNDGFNDTWIIENLDDQMNAELYIYDRFGKLIKQLALDGSGWDGSYNARLMPSADYWFSVKYTDPNTGIPGEFKAHFALKR